MELASVNTPAAALVAGLVTSLHCAGMCGPLACLLGTGPAGRSDVGTVQAVYHEARLTGYGVLGLAAGALGAAPAAWLDAPVARALPWILAGYFLWVGLRLGSRFPRLALLGRVQLRLRGWARGREAWQVAAVMGAATPLLPCGPLYFLVALAGFAGSPVAGAELMLAFGLGTVPLLWLAQSRVAWLGARLGPGGLERARAWLALASAVVIVWRLRADLGLAGPGWDAFVCH